MCASTLAETGGMTQNLPAVTPAPAADAGLRHGAPSSSLLKATYLAALPSLLLGGYLVLAVLISTGRGEEDEWGIGPFILGVGLVLVALPAAGVALARLGQRTELRTSRRSVWSVLGLGLAIVAAVPSGLIFLVLSQR